MYIGKLYLNTYITKKLDSNYLVTTGARAIHLEVRAVRTKALYVRVCVGQVIGADLPTSSRVHKPFPVKNEVKFDTAWDFGAAYWYYLVYQKLSECSIVFFCIARYTSFTRSQFSFCICSAYTGPPPRPRGVRRGGGCCLSLLPLRKNVQEQQAHNCKTPRPTPP